MGAAILIMADTEGDLSLKAIVIGSILLVLLATLVMLLLGSDSPADRKYRHAYRQPRDGCSAVSAWPCSLYLMASGRAVCWLAAE